jgi:uncharacterized protein (TIGR02145 family)
MKRMSFIRLRTAILLVLLLFQLEGCKKEENITITDIDGNVYSTTTIGQQVWMAENLKTTKLNNNTGITMITSNSAWASTTKPARCWYNNDTTYKTVYGAIYNWYTVGTGKVCPAGWHVPTHEEFKVLEMYLGMTRAEADSWDWRGTNQGSQLKNHTGWANNGNGSNASGFSALPGGYRWAVTGEFFNMGELSYWWSSSENTSNQGVYRRLDNVEPRVYAQGVKKQGGKYIRCVKD